MLFQFFKTSVSKETETLPTIRLQENMRGRGIPNHSTVHTKKEQELSRVFCSPLDPLFILWSSTNRIHSGKFL